jgi:hypothetical protein
MGSQKLFIAQWRFPMSRLTYRPVAAVFS